MWDKLLELIDKYDTICVARHVNPDGDANGSQFGIVTYLQENYPNKKIYPLGIENKKTFFPPCYHGEVDFSCALAIVCDTANRERIDGEGIDQCKEIVKIDHHPVVDNFGSLNIVDEKTCATCEIIARMMMEAGVKLSKLNATYLYCGLLTDSQRFSLPSVTPKTFEIASYLLSFGVDIQLCNRKMFMGNLDDYQFETYIRSKIQIVDGHLAYIVVDQHDYEQFNLSFQKAKEKIYVLANVEEFEIYCLFTQDMDGSYVGSLRSRKTLINDVAAKYHGGGHQFACGVKKLNKEMIVKIVSELNSKIGLFKI